MKNNKGLFDKKRFAWQEAKRRKQLKELSMKKSVKMVEELASLANEFRRNFLPDKPLCLKIGLKKNRR